MQRTSDGAMRVLKANAAPLAVLAVVSLAACAGPPIAGSYADVKLSGPEKSALSIDSNPMNVWVALKDGANPNVYGRRGRTPLHVHVCREITEDTLRIVDILLDAGASPNLREKEWEGGDTALHRALKCNSGDRNLPVLLARLLKGGADPNLAAVGARTPLFTAIEFSNPREDAHAARVVSELLKGGASPDIHLDGGNTPLHHLMCSRDMARGKQRYSARSTKLESMAALLKGGADPNKEKVFSGNFASEGERHSHYDERGIFAGEDGPFHYEDFHSGPPLSFACDPKAAAMLIEAGANVGHAAKIALQDGRSRVVIAMLASGVDPDTRDAEGYTLLHLAAMAGDAAVIRSLLKAGADPNARDSVGDNTPLHLVGSEDSRTATTLLRGGADPTLLNARGESAERPQ